MLFAANAVGLKCCCGKGGDDIQLLLSYMSLTGVDCCCLSPSLGHEGDKSEYARLGSSCIRSYSSSRAGLMVHLAVETEGLVLIWGGTN